MSKKLRDLCPEMKEKLNSRMLNLVKFEFKKNIFSSAEEINMTLDLILIKASKHYLYIHFIRR